MSQIRPGNKLLRILIIGLISLVYTTSISSCTNEDAYLDEQYPFIAPDPIINPESEYIIVIGDIQESTQTWENLEYLIYSLDWIRNQQNHYGNIKCLLQDGDITNNNLNWQWDMALNAFHHLKDSTMYVWCTGNHDYTWGGENNFTINDRNSSLLDDYLVDNHLLNSNIIAWNKNGSYHNIVVKNMVKGERLDIISLEFGTPPEVITWAAEYVRSNPTRRFILMTHEYMTRAGERVSDDQSYAKSQFVEYPHTGPEYVWENLVYPNDNILCVVNGHNGFCKYLETKNAKGRMVPQILFNLQYQENGGDSMIQLWEFPKHENRVVIKVYNTLKQIFPEPESTSFTFTY